MNRKEFLKLYNFAHKENPKFNDIMNDFLTDDILSTVEFIYNKEMSHDEWKDFADKNFFDKFNILKASSKHDKDNFANQLTLLIQGYNKVKDKELGENCLYFLSVSNALFSSNNVPFDIKEEVFLYAYEFLKDDPYFVAREFFKNENITPYQIDKIIWLICSGKFYYERISVGQHKKELIQLLQENIKNIKIIPRPTLETWLEI